MRSVLAMTCFVLLAACGEATNSEAPIESPPASVEIPAPALDPAVEAAAAAFSNAESYDAFDPPTPYADEAYNRSASVAGTRTCAELLAAAIADDVNGVQNILRSGVSIDCRDGAQSETALMAAAGAASADATRYLLDHGANVNAGDAQGRTARYKAQTTRDQLVGGEQLPTVVPRLDAILALLRERGGR